MTPPPSERPIVKAMVHNCLQPEEIFGLGHVPHDVSPRCWPSLSPVRVLHLCNFGSMNANCILLSRHVVHGREIIPFVDSRRAVGVAFIRLHGAGL